MRANMDAESAGQRYTRWRCSPSDVRAVLNIVSRTLLTRRLKELTVEKDLIRWTNSSMAGELNLC